MSDKLMRLQDLRSPPKKGAFYLVPVVERYPYHSRIDDWPVIGPLHADAEFFSFPDIHYHVDPRFLTEMQARFLERKAVRFFGTAKRAEQLDRVVGGFPLSHRGLAPLKGRPPLRARKCRSSTYGYRHGLHSAVQQLNQAFIGRQNAICLKDGRKLCPHRKVDLSTFAPDADGIVTCPLHGLHVQVGAPS